MKNFYLVAIWIFLSLTSLLLIFICIWKLRDSASASHACGGGILVDCVYFINGVNVKSQWVINEINAN